MELKVIFEDKHLLIIDKPAGWIVNEARTTKDTPVIQTALSKNFNYEIAKVNELRSGIVHRLDKETSGVLVVAKTEDAFRKIQLQFKQRAVKKEYLALVHGRIEIKEGEIEAPVGRLPWNRERFGILPSGREAHTYYKVSKYYKNKKETFSFVILSPKTGRTHQIRIHLKHINHPIVSDEFYAGRKTAREDRKFCPRLYLHASKISLINPKTNKAISFDSKLPKDLDNVLASLEKIEETT